MSSQLGIIGLPNAGKSTLFNALTAAGAQAENYPFCTIEPNVGVIEVPDRRLEHIASIVEPERVVPAAVEFVDIAGLVEGASRGEGLGNQFLAHIREVDALIHIVRCFRDDNVAHVAGRLDPVQDIQMVENELILADLETVENRIEKTERMLKTGKKEHKEQLAALKRLHTGLSEGQPIRDRRLDDLERRLTDELFLLTEKPVLYVANVSEEGFGSLRDDSLYRDLCETVENDQLIAVAGQLEAEIAEFTPGEREAFLAEAGIEDSGLVRLIRAAFNLLDLIIFFTAVGPELRAWTAERGISAPQAAGKIHSDMERGFIKAEVINYKELAGLDSLSEARDRGLVRTEGKDYIVKDGDICEFKFNV